MDLKDRVVVVTGASSGIGEAIARDLSEAGAKVVLTARRAERLEALSRELAGESAILAASIADADTPARLLALALERFGRADGLVNNAGALAMGSIDEADIEALADMVRVNFEAVVRASYVFARHLKAQKSGAIINVSSAGAFGVTPAMGVYSGTKAAVQLFTSALRVELGPHGVKVGTVVPAGNQTPMLEDMYARRGIKPAALLAQPSDIAAAVRFMLEQPERANIANLQLYAAGSPV